jgi:hypothetical protein
MLSDEVLQRVQRRFRPPADALVLDATWSTWKQVELVTGAL